VECPSYASGLRPHLPPARAISLPKKSPGEGTGPTESLVSKAIL
jgi:hypothetical protein